MIKLIRLRILIDFAEAAVKLIPRATSMHSISINNRVESNSVVNTRLMHRTSHK